MRLTKALLLGALSLGLGTACAPANPGLTAEGVIAADAMCLVTSSNALLVEGTLDIDTSIPATYRPRGISYGAAFRVGNQLINTANRVYPLQADTSRIVINHVEVTLLDTSENVLSLGVPNPFLVPGDGAIGSTSSMDPTIGIAAATVIPDSYGQILATMYAAGGTILVRARIIGTTDADLTLTSGPVVFPIRLCVGCLFQRACDAMGHPLLTLSCLPGQDARSLIPGSCP